MMINILPLQSNVDIDRFMRLMYPYNEMIDVLSRTIIVRISRCSTFQPGTRKFF